MINLLAQKLIPVPLSHFCLTDGACGGDHRPPPYLGGGKRRDRRAQAEI